MRISIVIQLQNTITFFFIGHNYFVLRNTVLFDNVAVYYVGIVKKILFLFGNLHRILANVKLQVANREINIAVRTGFRDIHIS